MAAPVAVCSSDAGCDETRAESVDGTLSDKEWGPDLGQVPVIGPIQMLGSGCHQLSIMRGCLGRMEDGDLERRSLISATLKFQRGVRCVFTTVFMPDIRLFDYSTIRLFNKTLNAFGDGSSTHILFPSPFLKQALTMVVCRGMENGRHVEREITIDCRKTFRNE